MTRASATALAAQIARGETSATAVLDAALRRCATRDRDLGCFVEYFAEDALARAAAVDQDRAAGRPLGPLAGVPVALKDNLLLQGRVAACGSLLLEHFVAPYSSAAAERLLAAGAIVLGRTNMDEFGMGSSTERSAFGPTRNPWDPDRVPGGSSGGAAAAVAAGLCPLAVGSDTGGSVRQPAALCGVTGLKPTYGRISRWGLVAYASSLDTVGILAGDAADAALLFAALAGHDPRDATSRPEPVPEAAALLAAPPPGLRLGVLPDSLLAGVDPAVLALLQAALPALQDEGDPAPAIATLPHLRPSLSAYYLIATAEAAANLARYDGVRFGSRRAGRAGLDAMLASTRSQGFGPEVQNRILLGTHALRAGYRDALYGQASRVRTLLQRDFAQAFGRCDVLVLPTAPAPAFALGHTLEDPAQMVACDLRTVPASLAGLPAISLPCGFTADGLPVGLQLVAPPLREDLLLQLAHRFQQRCDHHRRRPPLAEERP